MITALKRLERLATHATANWSPTSKARPARPSASVTSLEVSTDARVEPSATVTTRSNAFIFESVRFPETRSSATSATYAAVPWTTTRQTFPHPSKIMEPPTDRGPGAVNRYAGRLLAAAPARRWASQ